MLAFSEGTTTLFLASAIFALAVLYSSVGHAGASGYLAAMALMTDFSPEQMKSVALMLNLVVGIIGSWHFLKSGSFRWTLFWPLGLTAIPMAFLGGLWQIPPTIFRPLIGLVLCYAAVMLVIRARRTRTRSARRRPLEPRAPGRGVLAATGAALGFLAGATGTGGGIFLSPVLLFAGWATARETAAVTIVFVLTNSLAGLGGVVADAPSIPSGLFWWGAAAAAGGMVGARLGARHLPGEWIRLVLAAVLMVAAAKMFLTSGGSASDTHGKRPPPVPVRAPSTPPAGLEPAT